MDTKILKKNEINEAAKILRAGGLVVIPTETVYGLAADALNKEAVKKIFYAKGRPSDNPLIVHISEIDEIYRLVDDFTDDAKKLVNALWPGPLTIILKRSNLIIDEVSGGLDTVAIRMPSHPIAREVIKATGRPLAAPSANISGKPSPTKFSHVKRDMLFKVDAILDGGDCAVGLESTIVLLGEGNPRILRPGAITASQIKEIIGKEVEIDPAVVSRLSNENMVPISPGMKYKHYAPRARVVVVKAKRDEYIKYVNSCRERGVVALCYSEDIKSLTCKAIPYGDEGDSKSQARNLFDALRKIDMDNEAKIVYARCPEEDGEGLAVYNRLIRAAGFEVLELDE